MTVNLKSEFAKIMKIWLRKRVVEIYKNMSVKHVGITNKNERGKSVRETNKISSKKRVGV